MISTAASLFLLLLELSLQVNSPFFIVSIAADADAKHHMNWNLFVLTFLCCNTYAVNTLNTAEVSVDRVLLAPPQSNER